jgi:hypothetical protein
MKRALFLPFPVFDKRCPETHCRGDAFRRRVTRDKKIFSERTRWFTEKICHNILLYWSDPYNRFPAY